MLTHHVRRDVPGPMTVWVLERTPVPGRGVEVRTARPQLAGEVDSPRPSKVSPRDVLDSIGRMALELGTGRGRSSPSPAGDRTRRQSTKRARAELQHKLDAVESELGSLLARVAPEDPDAAARVRQAIDELRGTFDSLE